MRTPASIAGHPIHPMLVTFPIGLWVFSLVADLIYAFGTGFGKSGGLIVTSRTSRESWPKSAQPSASPTHVSKYVIDDQRQSRACCAYLTLFGTTRARSLNCRSLQA